MQVAWGPDAVVAKTPALAERPPERLNDIHPDLVSTIVASAGKMPLAIRFGAPLPYDLAVDFQQHLVELTQQQPLQPILLLLQHPLVVTLGRGANPADAAGCSQPLVRSHRGGSVTVHGPGQVVGYPILDLRRQGLSVHGYVRQLELMLRDVCSIFNVDTATREGLTGLWTPNGKIASIGIAVRRGIAWHGFALYVDDQRKNFGALNPCALPGVAPDAIGTYASATWHEAASACATTFSKRFNLPPFDTLDIDQLIATDGLLTTHANNHSHSSRLD